MDYMYEQVSFPSQTTAGGHGKEGPALRYSLPSVLIKLTGRAGVITSGEEGARRPGEGRVNDAPE